MSRESADCIRREVKENNPGASGEDGPDHRRFRPNLVASGAAAPFAEDGWWPAVRVGEDAAVLRACSLCQRCELVNVDPDAGRKTRGGEPLRTLRTFRYSDSIARIIMTRPDSLSPLTAFSSSAPRQILRRGGGWARPRW